jgi:hypothetical protein
MIPTILFLLSILCAEPDPGQDPRIESLIKRLDAEDWADQAQAAKELDRLGGAVLGPLGAAALGDAPGARYWAGVITDSIRRKAGKPATTKEPAPAPAPAMGAVSPGFNPGEDDVGSVMFICNNAKHGDYEVVLSHCPTCAKAKKFSFDHDAKVFRCAVCKRPYAPLKCNRCGDPPGPRTRVRMKRH